MGRPRQPLPLPAGPSRRDFFKRSSSATVAVAAAGSLVAQASPAKTPAAVFAHGVASGDPLSDRVMLWTRVTPDVAQARVSVDWRVARDPGMTDVVRHGQTHTHPGRDWTVKLDVDGLQPATTYYYQFRQRKTLSPVGRTRTLPVGEVSHLRLGVVSCSNIAFGYFNAYARLAERTDLDLVIHLGDYLYEYGSGQYGNVRACEPAHEILTLEDYRQRHAQYKRDADAQALHRQHPVVPIWDDHETANDAWAGGAQNHQPDTEGPWPARVQAALQAYDEWMPVRTVSLDKLARQRRSYRLGDLAELFMLEERLTSRSQQLPATLPSPLGLVFTQTGEFLDPGRTLLGLDGEQRLVRQLRKSDARWKLLGQGVMMAQLKAQGAPNSQGGGAFLNPDQWDGYQPARDRLYQAVRGADGKAPIGNLVVLTGDIHSSWAADLTPDPNNPDLATGGYDAATGRGSLAVEFVGTSVTSPGVDDPNGQTAAYLKGQNPHFKYVDLNRRGYMLLDLTPQRVVCEWWHLNTVAQPDAQQSMAVAYQVLSGQPHLAVASQTAAKAQAPAPAP